MHNTRMKHTAGLESWTEIIMRIGLMSDTAEIKWATPSEVQSWIAAGEAVIVDVREMPEFAAGHIPGAHLNPLSAFDPAKVPGADGKKLVLHCAAGNRCGPASQMLAASGRKGTIYRLQGGIMGYAQAGGAIER